MSVVPNDFEALKRYNLAEIFDPTPKEQFAKNAKEARETKEEPKEAAKLEAAETSEKPLSLQGETAQA